MYVALLSTILVLFFIYLANVIGQPKDVNVEVNVPLPQECPTDEPEITVNDNPIDEDLFDKMYAQATTEPTTRPHEGGPEALKEPRSITTLKPFDAFDTTGLQQTEQLRTLATVANASALQNIQRAPLELECSEQPDPCEEEVVWRNSFPGCGSFHIPLKAKNYSMDHRVWQGDLNPKLQERMALLDKEWNPYEHQRARQAYMQFIATNFSSKSDKYMEAIDDIDDVDPVCINEVEPVLSL